MVVLVRSSSAAQLALVVSSHAVRCVTAEPIRVVRCVAVAWPAAVAVREDAAAASLRHSAAAPGAAHDHSSHRAMALVGAAAGWVAARVLARCHAAMRADARVLAKCHAVGGLADARVLASHHVVAWAEA